MEAQELILWIYFTLVVSIGTRWTKLYIIMAISWIQNIKNKCSDSHDRANPVSTFIANAPWPYGRLLKCSCLLHLGFFFGHQLCVPRPLWTFSSCLFLMSSAASYFSRCLLGRNGTCVDLYGASKEGWEHLLRLSTLCSTKRSPTDCSHYQCGIGNQQCKPAELWNNKQCFNNVHTVSSRTGSFVW